MVLYNILLYGIIVIKTTFLYMGFPFHTVHGVFFFLFFFLGFFLFIFKCLFGFFYLLLFFFYFTILYWFMGFSRQEYWSSLPFPSPVDHVLSALSTMTCPSWVALHGMANSFIELDKAVVHVIVWLIFCDCGFHSVCPLMK